MRLGGQRQSGNVEDRRAGGGGRGRVAITGGTVVLVLIVSAITGTNPLTLLGALTGGGGGDVSAPSTSGPVDPNDPGAVFVRQVLATTEDAWDEAMPKVGGRYAQPKLVLFRDGVDSACGFQSAAVGPFYCPPDQRAYLDLDFFDDLQTKLGAAGDFAAGYVIAHEIGHHVQNQLGTSDKVRSAGKETGATGNAVRMELQADCYAGVWGAYVQKKGILDTGDVEEALRAAQAIGDDTLQRRAGGRVRPESFSHGTSEQRARWFKRGLDKGDPTACDTFGATSL